MKDDSDQEILWRQDKRGVKSKNEEGEVKETILFKFIKLKHNNVAIDWLLIDTAI